MVPRWKKVLRYAVPLFAFYMALVIAFLSKGNSVYFSFVHPLLVIIAFAIVLWMLGLLLWFLIWLYGDNANEDD